MSDLIPRAQAFATQAHQRIDQRRKYSGQPYDVHLAAVAEIVARVADDPEMVAAAWLHDVVEGTPVTLDDVGREFGADAPPAGAMAGLMPQLASPRIARLFRETFTAGDVLDRLYSFDADHTQAELVRAMAAHQQSVAGLRVDGAVQGFVRVAGQLLDAQAPLIDVVGVLTRHDLCFVTSFDAKVGVIERDAVNKPVVRMWLFGALTLYEMGST